MSGWRSLRLVAFDTETTGLSPLDGHRIVEFAGVELRLAPLGLAVVRKHVWLFRPGEMLMPRDTTEISGIRDEELVHAPLFAQHAEAIHQLLAGAVTVAHNYLFDRGFLEAEFARCGMSYPVPAAEIDTVDLSKRFHPEAKSHRLSELAARLNVPLVGAHRAANDAEACGRCFAALAGAHHAPDDLAGLLTWADALGEPPGDGIGRALDGTIVFVGGEHAGERIEDHTDYLAWMPMARHRVDGRWAFVFSEPARTWAERWLQVRASGRFPQAMKGGHASEWAIDAPLGGT